MRINGMWTGIVFIIFGVLVLVFPDLLRWLVGIFFIVAGIFAFVRRR